MLLQAVVLLLVVAVVAVIGVRIGMLVAPWFDRLGDDPDEESRVDD